MQLGAPETTMPRMPWRVSIEQCTRDEPMTLSIRVNRGGVWRKVEQQAANWQAAIRLAYTVMGKLWPDRVRDDENYFPTFRDGTYAPKLPYWTLAGSDVQLIIWPARMFTDYYRRLGEGTAYPMVGDEALFKPN